MSSRKKSSATPTPAPAHGVHRNEGRAERLQVIGILRSRVRIGAVSSSVTPGDSGKEDAIPQTACG
jgi:hypothetical protein